MQGSLGGVMLIGVGIILAWLAITGRGKAVAAAFSSPDPLAAADALGAGLPIPPPPGANVQAPGTTVQIPWQNIAQFGGALIPAPVVRSNLAP